MTVHLQARGVFSWAEWTEALSQEIPLLQQQFHRMMGRTRLLKRLRLPQYLQY